MQTNPAVEQSNIVRWSESPCNQSGDKTEISDVQKPNLLLQIKALASDWARICIYWSEVTKLIMFVSLVFLS